jgi:glutaredoxin
MKITVYRKSGCPWAAAVIGFLNELKLPHDVKNVTVNPEYVRELEQRTGKCKSPSVEVDGTMLAEASVEDVAAELEKRGIEV